MWKVPKNSGRTVEYPWTAQHLAPSGSRILDVGCGYSPFPKFLVESGYDVYGMDINPEWIPDVLNLKKIGQDIRCTSFPDEFFDQILFITTLEHIGMDWYYNKWLDERGDFNAICETWRILKGSGSVLITVPYWAKYYTFRAFRVYDDDRIKRLLEGFEIQVSDYFVFNGEWRPASKDEAIRENYKTTDENQVSAIICLKANRSCRR